MDLLKYLQWAILIGGFLLLRLFKDALSGELVIFFAFLLILSFMLFRFTAWNARVVVELAALIGAFAAVDFLSFFLERSTLRAFLLLGILFAAVIWAWSTNFRLNPVFKRNIEQTYITGAVRNDGLFILVGSGLIFLFGLSMLVFKWSGDDAIASGRLLVGLSILLFLVGAWVLRVERRETPKLKKEHGIDDKPAEAKKPKGPRDPTRPGWGARGPRP